MTKLLSPKPEELKPNHGKVEKQLSTLSDKIKSPVHYRNLNHYFEKGFFYRKYIKC